MLIAGIDLETTGVNCETDKICEVGCVLWEWETSKPLQMLSKLVRPGMPIPPEATKVNGIDDELVDCYGEEEHKAFKDLVPMVAAADYAMAHFAPFDRGFYDAAVKRIGILDCGIFWIDTSIDIPYPEHITTRNLRHLAAEHGFLNPFSHRAVFDVLTMLQIAKCYSLDDIINRAKEPTLIVQAVVDFEDKDKAKERGYRWHPQSKTWWRTWKQSDYMIERDTCGFRTELMEKAPE